MSSSLRLLDWLCLGRNLLARARPPAQNFSSIYPTAGKPPRGLMGDMTRPQVRAARTR